MTAKDVENAKFRADWLKAHRKRTALSAEDYGKLVGASGQSVYAWESGRTRPRKEQVGALASIRGIGRREAQERLRLMKAG